MKKIPLLITASLDSGATPMVSLRDVRERTLSHMEGLLAWFKDPNISQIVFAKNCRARIRVDVLMEAAREHAKELEFIQVDSSPRTAVQGKGYGEGDLIRQALERSDVLRDSPQFLKITGKLFMPNTSSVFTGEGEGEFFEMGREKGSVFPTRHLLRPLYRSAELGRVMASLRKCRVPWEFIAAPPSGWIDTRCYRVGVDFYREMLLRSHERVQDALGYTLENAVQDDLQAAPNICRISSPPVIIGASGTLGTILGSFSEEVRNEAREVTLRIL
jgi:hypothetical protein